MVVRVKVEIKRGDRVAETAAVANTGYEADVPELHLPLALARYLGIPLHALPGESYRVVGGSTHALILGEVLVRVVAEDRCSEWVRARAVSVPGEHEVLLSDKLLDALGLEIVKAGLGYWRFSGEAPERVRRSVEAQFWVE
uniref:Clan AA aspartic protease n=1 Tax=Thermofilum pendens TaxID=2269 RepID=A0A7J3X874_THEPE